MAESTTKYRAYATNSMLRSIFKDYTTLFIWLVDYMKISLMDDYIYKGDSFPLAQSQENAQQTRTREDMVTDWVDGMEPRIPQWDEWNHSQRVTLLNDLFYSIWRLDFQKTSAITVASQATSRELPSNASSSEALGNVDARALLVEDLPNIKRLHSKRYRRFIDNSPDLVEKLLGMIRPEVLQVIRKPRISRQDLLDLGGDLDRQGPAIYLHILWHPEMSDHEFYLYVGQAIIFVTRFGYHTNPLWRIKHPSLHYFVWDASQDMEEAFVLLAIPERDRLDHGGLMLNLIEFWNCLIFQSLGAEELGKFVSTRILQQGHQLNVANPLWQGFKGEIGLDEGGSYEKKEHFQKLIRDASPVTREYFLSLAQAFRDMKDSPNAALRQYCLSARQRGQLTSAGTRTQQTIRDLLAGVEKPVKHHSRAQQVFFGHVNLIIWKDLAVLAENSTVHVQGYLAEGAVSNCYAKKASPVDPASRLSIRVTREDSTGKQFSTFIYTDGPKALKDINTLVDMLDGKNDDEIAQLPNRRIPSSAINSRPKHLYY